MSIKNKLHCDCIRSMHQDALADCRKKSDNETGCYYGNIAGAAKRRLNQMKILIMPILLCFIASVQMFRIAYLIKPELIKLLP